MFFNFCNSRGLFNDLLITNTYLFLQKRASFPRHSQRSISANLQLLDGTTPTLSKLEDRWDPALKPALRPLNFFRAFSSCGYLKKGVCGVHQQRHWVVLPQTQPVQTAGPDNHSILPLSYGDDPQNPPWRWFWFPGPSSRAAAWANLDNHQIINSDRDA